MDLTPFRRRFRDEVPPLALILTLLFVGLASLLLLWFQSSLGSPRSNASSVHLVRFAFRLEELGHGRIVWSAAAVEILLTVYLWIEGRRRERLFRWVLVGAAVLLAALHWAIVAAVQAVPHYALEQIFP